MPRRRQPLPWGLTTQTLLLLLLAAPAACWGRQAASPSRLADQYGFLPLEVHKLEDRLTNLIAADLDGDKADDLAVADNARSRIDLLLTSTGPDEADATKGEPNEIRGDRRMRLVTVPVNREIVSLKAGDLDGDGRIDLAFFGSPAELQVLHNEGGGRFAAPRRFETGPAVESSSALTVADLNGDGRMDLALLASGEVLVLLQDDSGRLQAPERWPHAATRPRLLWVRDMDGDGRTDLVIGDADETAPVRIRFREASGRLGAEERFAVEDPRAYELADLDGKPGCELLTIEDRSGRVQWLSLEEDPKPDPSDATGRKGRAQIFPLGPRADARNRAVDLGDLDGDGRADVVATDPSRAQVLVFLQGDDGLRAAREFPSLSGTKGIRLTDLDGDGKAEVLVLSGAEKQLGVSTFDPASGRLPLPTPLPVAAEPLAFAAGNIDADPSPEIVYAVATGAKPPYALRAIERRAGGTFAACAWAGGSDTLPLEGLTSTPTAIQVVDANADGLADFLVFRGGGTPVLVLGRADQAPEVFAGGPGPLASAEPAAVTTPPDGKGLIVAQGNYAREVRIDPAGRWEVRESFHSGLADATIQGAVRLPRPGGQPDLVALWDRSNRSVLWLEVKDGVYRPAGRLEVGSLEFLGLRVANLDGDDQPDLLVAGSDRFAAVLTGRVASRFRSVASYGPSRRDAYLGDLIVGDLNGDHRPDVLTLDTGKNFVDILAATLEPSPRLESALAFPIFETKSFSARDERVEPRGVALGDLDGDGRTDFALLVHDRVLIYRQDPGPSEPAKAASTSPAPTAP
jgi:hypothetical protein